RNVARPSNERPARIVRLEQVEDEHAEPERIPRARPHDPRANERTNQTAQSRTRVGDVQRKRHRAKAEGPGSLGKTRSQERPHAGNLAPDRSRHGKAVISLKSAWYKLSHPSTNSVPMDST